MTVAEEVMGRVAPVASYRIDPDFARSDRRRLIYVRFAGVPIFWRADLEVVARSVVNDPDYDRGNPQAADTSEWSPFESALLNGLAASKAYIEVTMLWHLIYFNAVQHGLASQRPLRHLLRRMDLRRTNRPMRRWRS